MPVLAVATASAQLNTAMPLQSEHHALDDDVFSCTCSLPRREP